MSEKCRHCYTAELSDSPPPSAALCYCAVLERAEVRLREAVEIARGLEAACAAKDAALTRALDLCDDAYCKNGSGGPEDCDTCAAIKAALDALSPAQPAGGQT